jgi:hypothetical protein
MRDKAIADVTNREVAEFVIREAKPVAGALGATTPGAAVAELTTVSTTSLPSPPT